MIYFVLFLCGAVTAAYWFIAGAIFGEVCVDLVAMEDKRLRFLSFVLSIFLWPISVLVGLFLDRHKEFEPQGWQDWVLIPWWYMCYAFAWCWTEVWRVCLRVRHWPIRGMNEYRWMTEPGHGRHDDPHPVMCPVCLWAGPRRWAVHTYGPCGLEDVEPVDECPRCGQEV